MIAAIFNQLNPASYFDVVRIVDPASNSIIKEQYLNPTDIPFPDLDRKQAIKYFGLCNSSKKTDTEFTL